MSITPAPTRRDVTALERLLESRLTCECMHGDDPCPERASARVTLVCAAEGCDNAADVYLLCPECVRVWRRRAKRDRVTLRVVSL